MLAAISAVFSALDHTLVWLARPFGVNIPSPTRRYAQLLGIYLAIYLLALSPLPMVPLVALGVGYIGVLAIGRAWVKNEKVRTAIVKKLRDGDPDELPDLRWTALVSALQILILFPLFFQQIQNHFGLYRVPEGVTLGHWLLFTLDHYSKAFLGLLDLYGIHINRIEPEPGWGRHLVLLKRLTIDWILIQGVIRIYAIHQTVSEGVAAVKVDRDMAVRLGRRAIRPLIAAMQNDSNTEVRASAAEALGKLRDPAVVEPLIEALSSPSEQVRERAAKALGEHGDLRAVEPLRRLQANDTDRYVKSAAEEALKRLTGQGVPRTASAVQSDTVAGKTTPGGWVGRLKGFTGRLRFRSRKRSPEDQDPESGARAR